MVLGINVLFNSSQTDFNENQLFGIKTLLEYSMKEEKLKQKFYWILNKLSTESRKSQLVNYFTNIGKNLDESLYLISLFINVVHILLF